MPVPGTLDLTVYQGDTLDLVITFPVDLTGCTVRMQVKDSPGGALVLSASSTDGDILIDTTEITFDHIPLSMAAGVYQHDIEVEFLSGSKRTYLAGLFTVVAEITS